MKEKFGIAFIVFLALLCLFGCSKELPEEDMVMAYSVDVSLKG